MSLTVLCVMLLVLINKQWFDFYILKFYFLWKRKYSFFLHRENTYKHEEEVIDLNGNASSISLWAVTLLRTLPYINSFHISEGF